MSLTVSPGRVSARHWTFVAGATASGLREAVKRHAFSLDMIPPGVYRDALNFFNRVREAFGPGVPPNPVASAANYQIATRALRATVAAPLKNRSELNSRLQHYAEIVSNLRGKRALGSKDEAEFLEVAGFLEKIAEDGEDEMYERCVGWGAGGR